MCRVRLIGCQSLASLLLKRHWHATISTLNCNVPHNTFIELDGMLDLWLPSSPFVVNRLKLSTTCFVHPSSAVNQFQLLTRESLAYSALTSWGGTRRMCRMHSAISSGAKATPD